MAFAILGYLDSSSAFFREGEIKSTLCPWERAETGTGFTVTGKVTSRTEVIPQSRGGRMWATPGTEQTQGAGGYDTDLEIDFSHHSVLYAFQINTSKYFF